MAELDAAVVGSGPNGLAAAARLAERGLRVGVFEGADRIGGGTRTDELTEPGFLHDVCSAIHPLAVASPFLDDHPLGDHGLEWLHPDAPLAHPLDDGTAVMLERSPEETAAGLDAADVGAWEPFMRSTMDGWSAVLAQFLGPPLRLPRRPFTLARFGLRALRSADALARAQLAGQRGRALFAGLAAHAFLPLTHPTSAAFGLVLGAAGHVVGWPLPRGGSQAIADALATAVRAHGGTLETGAYIRSLADLPRSRIVLLDVTPSQAIRIAPERLTSAMARRLTRFRSGPGVFKLDYALSEPVPWRAPEAARAGTVHLGGTLAEITAAEAEVFAGRHPQRPYVLVAQPSRFDPTRAPTGKHTLWAYCHVPNGSTVDMTAAIEGQLERFAPGFQDVVIARHAMTAADFEAYNPNYLGGDISGGAHDGLQLFARPRLAVNPYRLSRPDRHGPGIYLCSASTPPGGGVHFMCGMHAADAALAEVL